MTQFQLDGDIFAAREFAAEAWRGQPDPHEEWEIYDRSGNTLSGTAHNLADRTLRGELDDTLDLQAVLKAISYGRSNSKDNSEPFWPVLVSTFASNIDSHLVGANGLNSNDWDDFVVKFAKEVDLRRLTADREDRDFYAGDFCEAAACAFNDAAGVITFEELLAAGQAESDAIANIE